MMARGPIVQVPFFLESIELLRGRFATPELDGPAAYAQFMRVGPSDDARLRNEAVAIIGDAVAAFDECHGTGDAVGGRAVGAAEMISASRVIDMWPSTVQTIPSASTGQANLASFGPSVFSPAASMMSARTKT